MDDFRTALTLQVPTTYGSAGRLSDSGSDMGDSGGSSSGRGGSDPGTVLPKISIMSLGVGDGANMAANDARTTGDSRSVAGSSDIQSRAAISVSQLSQDQ